MADIRRIATVALGVATASWGLGWLYNKFLAGGVATISLAAIDINVKSQIQSGVSTNLATKLLGYLGGVIPQGGMVGALLTLYVASFLVVFIGSWVNENLTHLGRTPMTQFAWAMTLGSVGIGLFLGTMVPAIGALGGVIAMFIYYIIVAGAYNLVKKYLFDDLPTL